MPLHPVYDQRTGSLLHYTIYDRDAISTCLAEENGRRGRRDRGGEWHCIAGKCMAGVHGDECIGKTLKLKEEVRVEERQKRMTRNDFRRAN